MRHAVGMDLHFEIASLDAGLDLIRDAPKDAGPIELIVRRPANDEREVLDAAMLDPAAGMVGDVWSTKPTISTPDGSPHPRKQVTIMNARAARLVAGPGRERWALAGDQLFADLDLSYENLPPGTRLAAGEAVLEVSEVPHRGCKKFAARFGLDALRFVNSDAGKLLNLRGINTAVIAAGVVRAGDRITKL